MANVRSVTSSSWLAGLFLLLCALMFYYFAVLKIDYNESWLLDLGHSDASEYFAQAEALLKDGYPYLQIGYEKLPSEYPLGYPALMLPWLKILPKTDSILAPFRTNQTIGLLLILAVFGFYAYLAMPLTGGFAALTLATLPVFFTFCRSPMSEISASAFIIMAFMFAYLGLKEERRWKLYLAAAFLGLSLNIRLQSIFFGPLLLAMALFPARGHRLRWFLHCLGVLIVLVLAASPVLVLNTIQFHSPFKTGYHFWVPSLMKNHQLSSLNYVPTNVARLCTELFLRPLPEYLVSQFYGTGTCFVPAFVLLVCAGLFFIPVSRFVVCAFLAGFSYFAAAVSYKFSGMDVRFYLPLLLLLVAVAVLPVTWAAKNLVARKRLIAAAAIFVLFAMACLGYPSRSGEIVGTNRLQAWDALHFNNPPRGSIEFVAQKRLVQLLGSQPGIVFSDIDPAYLNALLPDPFVAAPLDGKRYVGFSEIFQYDRPQATALVKRGLKQSLPIYALFVSEDEVNEKAPRLPELDGYEWVDAQLIQAPSISVASTAQFTTAALPVAMPTMEPAPGRYGTYDGQKNVVIATTTPGAQLSYTMDGSTPTPTQGAITTYNNGTIVIPYGTTTLKVMAFRSGYTDSPVVSGNYTINRTTDAVILKLMPRNR